jgi:type VI secretion system protein ImpH
VQEGPAFDFFQAVYLCTHASRTLDPSADEKTALPVRIRPSEQRSFPSADVRSIRCLASPDGPRFAMTVAWMGLYGADGVLPPHASEHGLSADHEPPSPLRAFLDLFHQRLYTLLYQAWHKPRPSLHRPGREAPNRRDTRRFAALGGIDRPSLRPTGSPADSSPVSPLRLAAFAGRLGAMGRNAEGLQALLAGVLPGLRVRIEENILRRYPIPQPIRLETGRTRLGHLPPLGRTVADRSSAFRIHVGPLGPAAYRDLLPGGHLAQRVAAIVRWYVPDLLDYDIHLHRSPSASTDVVLGDRTARLDATTILGRPRATTHTVRYAATNGSVSSGEHCGAAPAGPGSSTPFRSSRRRASS